MWCFDLKDTLIVWMWVDVKDATYPQAGLFFLFLFFYFRGKNCVLRTT